MDAVWARADTGLRPLIGLFLGALTELSPSVHSTPGFLSVLVPFLFKAFIVFKPGDTFSRAFSALFPFNTSANVLSSLEPFRRRLEEDDFTRLVFLLVAVDGRTGTCIGCGTCRHIAASRIFRRQFALDGLGFRGCLSVPPLAASCERGGFFSNFTKGFKFSVRDFTDGDITLGYF